VSGAGLDNRPAMTYRGDASGTVGQVVGPTLAGEFLTVDEAAFDATTGTTAVRFRYAVVGDLAQYVTPDLRAFLRAV